MSNGMWTLFGSGKAARVSKNGDGKASARASIERLRESVERAEKRQEHVQRKIEEEAAAARLKLGRGDKRAALFAVKRKKMYEAEYDKLESVKMTLETQAIQLESAADNQETVGAMQAGTSAMTRLRQAVGLEKVDAVMDDMRDEMDVAQEINTAIGAPLDPYMEDDADLLAELEALDESPKRDQASSMFSMPSVPMFGKKPKKSDAIESRRIQAA